MEEQSVFVMSVSPSVVSREEGVGGTPSRTSELEPEPGASSGGDLEMLERSVRTCDSVGFSLPVSSPCAPAPLPLSLLVFLSAPQQKKVFRVKCFFHL